MKKAYGFIEMLGLASAVVAADTALKAANVEFTGLESAKGAGMHTLKLSGEVSSVKAAVSSILGEPSLRGRVFAHTVIARPSEGTAKIIEGADDLLRKEKEEPEKEVKEATQAPEAEEPREPLVLLVTGQEDEAPVKDDEVLSVEPSTEEPAGDAGNNEVPEPIQIEAPLEPQPEKPLEAEASLRAVKKEPQETVRKNREVKKKIASCNLCLDPECKRQKGEPRSRCMHYKEKE